MSRNIPAYACHVLPKFDNHSPMQELQGTSDYAGNVFLLTHIHSPSGLDRLQLPQVHLHELGTAANAQAKRFKSDIQKQSSTCAQNPYLNNPTKHLVANQWLYKHWILWPSSYSLTRIGPGGDSGGSNVASFSPMISLFDPLHLGRFCFPTRCLRWTHTNMMRNNLKQTCKRMQKAKPVQ